MMFEKSMKNIKMRGGKFIRISKFISRRCFDFRAGVNCITLKNQDRWAVPEGSAPGPFLESSTNQDEDEDQVGEFPVSLDTIIAFIILHCLNHKMLFAFNTKTSANAKT